MMKVSAQNNFIYPNYTQNYAQNSVRAKSPSFCGAQRLTHMNIGMMGEGFIGNVLLKNVTKGTEELVNVFKNFDCGNEKYFLKNNEGGTIGEIMLKINKYFDYNRFIYKEDPSHVFVDKLRNYSNPNTPFWNKETDFYEGTGTRLLQIAQRRSDEAQCVGNIKLIPMPESRRYYTDKIGMIKDPTNPYGSAFILPPDKKEPLSKMYGGL